MRFASLSSSSRHGNSYLVEGPCGTRVLVDAGVRIRRLEAYLQALAVDPAALAGLFMTHDHSDHVAALAVASPLAVKYQIPVYATAGFWRSWDPVARRLPAALRRTVRPGEQIRLGGLQITAFAKPHDAAEPVSYLVAGAGRKVAVVTDLGHLPEHLHDLLTDCDGYIFESNHDEDMERRSGRAPYLVARVVGPHGHLSNLQAANALARLVTDRTRSVWLAHLSLDCNAPELALATVGARLSAGGWQGELACCPAGTCTGWVQVDNTV